MKRRISPRKQAGGLLTASPFLLPSLIGMLIFSVLPLIISGMISLTDWNGLDQLLPRACCKNTLSGWQTSKPS